MRAGTESRIQLCAERTRADDSVIPAPRVLPAGIRDPGDLVERGVLRAAVAGDPDAVRAVLAEVQILGRRLSRARLGSRDDGRTDVDDVTQEICLAAVRALRGFDADGALPLRAVVIGIARHKIADAVRAAARNRTDAVAEVPDAVDQAPRPEDLALAAEDAATVTRLLATLDPRQAEILVLRIVGGLSAEEVARSFGSTAGAVRVAQHRALAALRLALAASGGLSPAPV
ncbi:sigma-70 family RNA polymerase sigma factor [Pseudonocardia spirodelae]|uniref:Sigma-70 family RNA polymerase sigma factor n=1 Tax=Pseudonocardia spirodelae TaxID=3133431 RepID=A0ABU8TBY5_9PSEU